MKNKATLWGVISVIVCIIAIGGGTLIWTRTQSQRNTSNNTTAHSKVKSEETSHVSQSATTKDETNNLSETNLGPKTTAAAIAFYASKHFDDSWGKMYEVLNTKAGLTVDLSTQNVDEMVKQGTGVAYYMQPTSDGTSAPGLFSYPSYTLENDKTINFYQPNTYDKTVGTSNLKTVVAYVNARRSAAKIQALADQVKIEDVCSKDAQNGHGSTNSAVSDKNKLTEHYLNHSEDAINKAVVYYGIMNGITSDWENLKSSVYTHHQKVHFDEDSDYRGLIKLPDGSNTGCYVVFAAGNPVGGSPDRFYFTHEGSNGDRVDFTDNDDVDGGHLGTSVQQIIDYCNAHGGITAINKVHVNGNF